MLIHTILYCTTYITLQNLPQQWHSSRTLASYSLHPSSDADFLRSSSASAGMTSHDTSADTSAAASEYDDSSSSSSGSSSSSSCSRAELACVQHCIALRALLLNSGTNSSSSNTNGHNSGSYANGDSPESDTPAATAVAVPASALLQILSVVQQARFLHGPVVGARTVPGVFPAVGSNRQLQGEAVALLQAMLQPGGAIQQLCCAPDSSGKHYHLRFAM
jgi:hypothetical protein